MDLELKGRAALVTGASRGIGRAIARALAREGARVCLAARGEAGLAETAKALRDEGAEVTTFAGDLATREGAYAAVDAACASLGALDVLVNNVGGSQGTKGFEHATAEQWSSVLDSNLLSAVWCSQRAVPWMRDHGGGAIVHLSSICGREYCSSAPYSVAKAGVVALAREMSRSLAEHGIRVNSVAPGSIMFPGGSWDRRRASDPERIARMIAEELPWGRFGAPEEVADVVAFLCSRRASWVTGACLVVDGAQGRAL